MAQLLCISEHTVRRYLTMFYQTWDVEPRPRTNGPKKLLDLDQLVLLRLILAYPGIYLHELQSELQKMFGVTVSSSTICKTLKFMIHKAVYAPYCSTVIRHSLSTIYGYSVYV